MHLTTEDTEFTENNFLGVPGDLGGNRRISAIRNFEFRIANSRPGVLGGSRWLIVVWLSM
jgi:hypothetical protein